MTPANLALCDWGHANIAENTVTNVIGQKLVDLFKRRAVGLEPCLAVYSMVGHISNCHGKHSALKFINYNFTTHVGIIEILYK